MSSGRSEMTRAEWNYYAANYQANCDKHAAELRVYRVMKWLEAKEAGQAVGAPPHFYKSDFIDRCGK